MRSFFSLILVAVLSPTFAQASPAAAAQWNVRFAEARTHGNALTGCYGTASYQYVLPSVETLRRHRTTLLAAAKRQKLGTVAWSADADGRKPGNVFVVDLTDGSMRSVPRVSLPSPKAATFCQCRQFDLIYCTPSALPPLAPIFYSVADDILPAQNPHWQDPEGGLRWYFRYENACWPRSDAACRNEGLRLPTYAELVAAAPRLRETGIGAWARRSGKPLWSSDETGPERNAAWTLQLDNGRGEARPKPECLQAACVRQ